MRKRLVFKPLAEKVMTWIFVISLILTLTVNDFGNIEGLIIWLVMIAITIGSGALLKKYGRCFKG